ncbi:radical SAM protein [Blautia sp. MSJ-9]|uniref:radical SAM protein n=1 Tax=Blautia sp. MSJ-9 TaxID=2841511 RepID=UPI001C1110E9|nr:radical SAM protein [Blautia sp. MSJ-9]MBU5682070.1 radical SAM protein [Blautia sp. MSJ-9]
MYYQLNKNVYLVSGASNSCIYDLNFCRLYTLNFELLKQFKLLDAGFLTDEIEDIELKNCLRYFIDNGVVVLSKTMEKHDIKEIAYKNSKITFAWIEITNQCNLRCRHCYNESDAKCNKKMSIEQFKMVVDLLVAREIKNIQIIGGEPFWDKKLLREELDYAIGKFDRIEIFTNGTLVTDEWFEYLAKNKICVALSVYSYDKEEHDKVTGIKGAWEKTNSTISKLKEYKIRYRVCNVLMKDVELKNSNTDLYQLSTSKDIVRMSGRGNFKLLSDDLIKKRLITKQTFTETFTVAFCRRLITGHNCFDTRIYISADLNVYPCVMERRFKHCNIAECQNIMLNESIRKLNKDNIEDCKECEFRYACFDCRPNSLSNKMYEKPWYCTYDPRKGVWKDVEEFVLELKEKWDREENV